MTKSTEYIHSELLSIALFQEMGYHYYNGEQHQERSDITEVILKTRFVLAFKKSFQSIHLQLNQIFI